MRTLAVTAIEAGVFCVSVAISGAFVLWGVREWTLGIVADFHRTLLAGER